MTSFSLTTSDLNAFIPRILEISGQAGEILMRHYSAYKSNPDALRMRLKADKSPVTDADEESSALIVSSLQQLTPDIAVVSEEGRDKVSPTNGLYWTVDPLDGTKGFLNQNDHFYVKIALVENGAPVLGVIHEPVYDRFYYSVRGGEARKRTGNADETVRARQGLEPGKLRTVFNSPHYNYETYDAARAILQRRGLDVPALEDAAGMCKTAFYMAVATGEADLFINCGTRPELVNGNGHSWDYAPDCLILFNAGGLMIDLASGRLPRFDDPYRRMNAMIGIADNQLGKRYFPELKNDCL